MVMFIVLGSVHGYVYRPWFSTWLCLLSLVQYMFMFIVLGSVHGYVYCSWLEAANTNVIIFGFKRPRIEPNLPHSR
jgi:hypothetical protein